MTDSKSSNAAKHPPAPREHRTRRLAVGVSLAVHLALAVALLIYRPWVSGPEATDHAATSGSAGIAADTRPLTESTPVDEVTGEAVQEELARLSAQASAMSTDQNLERLEGLVNRLDQIADQQSLDRLSSQLHEWLGTTPRATSAPGSAEERFDADSAQIQDVRRTRDKDGHWVYACVMVDAKGQTIEAPLDNAAEGERLFRTFQLVNSSPLAGRIYRDFTMPLMDKLLSEESSGAEPSADSDAGTQTSASPAQ